MARTISTPTTCTRCHQEMPAGTRVTANQGHGYRHQHGCPPVPATVSSSATERQVQFVLDLQQAYWTPAVLGGRRYDRDELAALSKQEISRVIDALVSERDLQGA